MSQINPSKMDYTLLFEALLVATGASFNYFKSSPLMPSLIGEFKFSYGLGGLFSGVFGVPLLVLSIPSGLLIQRLDLRRAIVATSLLSIMGSLMVCLTHNIFLLFTGRFLEGTAMAIALIVAPYLVSKMDKNHMALGMSILMMFNPIGNVLSMTCSSLLCAFSWRAAWLTGIILPLMSLVFSSGLNQVACGVPQASTRSIKMFKKRDMYLVSLSQWGLTVSSMGYLMWMPTYMNEIHKLSVSLASLITSLFMVIGIPATLLGGLLISKFDSSKKVLATCFAIISALFPFTTHVNKSILAPYIIILGLFTGITPTIINLYVARIFGPLSSVGFGVLNMLRGFSLLFGPAIMGTIRDITNSWDLSFFILSTFSAISLIASFLLRQEF